MPRLNDKQRELLCDLMYRAFLEIRMLGWDGRAAQAADLADAFHNVPKGLWSDDFSLSSFRDLYLQSYERKYAAAERGKFYVKAVDAIMEAR
jgi:hypothetical protein